MGLGMGLRREPPAYDTGLRSGTSPWRLWGDVRGIGIDDSNNGIELRSRHVNVTAGIGRRIGSTFAAGLLVGYEDFDYRFSGLGTLRGEGTTVGAYGGVRLMQRLILDAMAAYTRLDYDVAAGTAIGGFDASRWLGSVGLTGSIALMHGLEIAPSARVYLLRENQDAWIDSLGTTQGERDFNQGRFSIGAKLSRSMPVSIGMLTPYAGLYGEYDFGSDTALPVGILGLGLNDGWSLRATAGIAVTAPSGFTLNLGGDLGGLGADYQTHSLRAGASLPF
jgi:hypothetical protein